MNRTLKTSLLFCLALLVCLLTFTACNDGNDGNGGSGSNNGNTHNHTDLESSISNASYETPYSELYSLCMTAADHKAEYNCDLSIEQLFEKLLCGEWKDENGNFISFTYIYSNYDNTVGQAWYSTNLQTSKISGNTYYYYTELQGNKMVIGYQDRITEEKTENFVITFQTSAISVFSKVEDKTYELSLNTSYDKVQRGNAKLAYIYLAKNVFSFKNPSSVQVTSCYVDYETKIIYVTIQAQNSYGAANNEEYKLYESGGSYYITEYSHDYEHTTNIDLEELNQKLQAFVSTGG